ncbi:2OG-Fe(II) oxygenase [Brevundimonas sp.]|jgi:hypothetical protein|uniref:2OG-Fe(II) oxygenase n=1 Tax=Brevundimonas sp. TaxID=1871086 RepID=UPI00289F99B6|nr:2OG-Fe(II) oxygenase [Brevundimonas sp.]
MNPNNLNEPLAVEMSPKLGNYGHDMCLPGDPFPSIRAEGKANLNYSLDAAAGRYLVVANLVNASEACFDDAVSAAKSHRAFFNDTDISFFGFLDAESPWRQKVQDDLPGVRWLFFRRDADVDLQRIPPFCWILVDPTLRVLARAPLQFHQSFLSSLALLPPPAMHGGGGVIDPPVLIVPRIFEPDFCAELIRHYDSDGGQPSGFMREVAGRTVVQHDLNYKRRRDVIIGEGPLRNATRARISRRLAPQISRAFQFDATRIERYLIAAYDGDEGGWFRPHRDNTTKGTAHRKFAVSINLNADYDGGELRFPEYGNRTYRPPLGGGCVFSCSLLHEAISVRRGRRYAFLPFLYDEAAAVIRKENAAFLGLTGLGDIEHL